MSHMTPRFYYMPWTTHAMVWYCAIDLCTALNMPHQTAVIVSQALGLHKPARSTRANMAGPLGTSPGLDVDVTMEEAGAATDPARGQTPDTSLDDGYLSLDDDSDNAPPRFQFDRMSLDPPRARGPLISIEGSLSSGSDDSDGSSDDQRGLFATSAKEQGLLPQDETMSLDSPPQARGETKVDDGNHSDSEESESSEDDQRGPLSAAAKGKGIAKDDAYLSLGEDSDTEGDGQGYISMDEGPQTAMPIPLPALHEAPPFSLPMPSAALLVAQIAPGDEVECRSKVDEYNRLFEELVSLVVIRRILQSSLDHTCSAMDL